MSCTHSKRRFRNIYVRNNYIETLLGEFSCIKLALNSLIAVFSVDALVWQTLYFNIDG